MMGKQTSFEHFRRMGEPIGFDFDEYGPSMAEPLPPEAVNRDVWKERLRHRGFSPGCLLESISHGHMDEYHIDDVERPERWELWADELGVDLLDPDVRSP